MKHSFRGYLSILIVSLFFLTLYGGCGKKQTETHSTRIKAVNLSIGRMRTIIWPEYDDPGVLAVYDGKFEDPNLFPREVTFLIPKGAVISDACSLSPKGQHFCQLYKKVSRGKEDEVKILLPFPNFYLSFHISPFESGTGKKRLDYSIPATYPIKTLEVDIQEPLRAEGFDISPPGGKTAVKDGFNHFIYTLSNIAKGEERHFSISYIKNDNKPSVDIKYSPMGGKKVWGSPYEMQRKVKGFVYVLFITGLAGLMVIAWFMLKGRGKVK